MERQHHLVHFFPLSGMQKIRWPVFCTVPYDNRRPYPWMYRNRKESSEDIIICIVVGMGSLLAPTVHHHLPHHDLASSRSGWVLNSRNDFVDIWLGPLIVTPTIHFCCLVIQVGHSRHRPGGITLVLLWPPSHLSSPGTGVVGARWEWASYQTRKVMGCACVRNAGKIFPATDFKGNL